MKLYWVTTEDHHEDWFIVAKNKRAAAKFHEDSEGYERGDASAEEILEIPDKIPSETGWPDDELLLSIGARFISNEQTRVVEIGGRRFCEGLLEATIRGLNDDLFELKGRGRLNNTPKTTYEGE